jgi:hypothetical protein
MKKTTAPWTIEQAACINNFQKGPWDGVVHCHGRMIATTNGLICPKCRRWQNWITAHATVWPHNYDLG